MSSEPVLLQLDPLYSAREQTFFTPETLFLSIGIGQPRHTQDDAIITLIHEGIHWRQFQGTTFGAFCMWVKHSQEMNSYRYLRELPRTRKEQLLQNRAAGAHILSLGSDTNLPVPPLEGSDLRDPVNLLRMLWYDHLFTYRYFRNSADIQFQPGPPQQMFASCIADAANTLVSHHPAWRDYAYGDVQDLYTFENIGKVAALGKDLGTKFLLEGAAAATEVLLHSVTVENRYLLSDEGATQLIEEQGSDNPLLEPTSLWYARDAFDRDEFLHRAEKVLPSSYGYALQVFFRLSGLDPGRDQSWVTALAVIDFALNGPLPPLVLPDDQKPAWEELYPPARFLKASFAARRCGELRLRSSHADFQEYFAGLSAATGFRNPCEYATTAIFDATVPDFEQIKTGPVWDALLGTPANYYTFLRWCQQSLWKARAANLPVLVNPVAPISDAMNTAKAHEFVSRLDYTAPIIYVSDGEIEHSFGSTPAFGTWLAVSSAAFNATTDLMVRVGSPKFPGFPPSLMRNEESSRLINSSIRAALDIDFDPWTG